MDIFKKVEAAVKELGVSYIEYGDSSLKFSHNGMQFHFHTVTERKPPKKKGQSLFFGRTKFPK